MATLDTRPARRPDVPLADVAAWAGSAVEEAPTQVRVDGVSLGSQRVRPGDLYAALPGARRHGAEFALDARAAGAVAVLTDPAGRALLPADLALPVLEVPQPRAVLGRVAAQVYGEPATAMAMIGVTGTQGKTTTTRLAEAALTAAGVRAGVVGTIGTRVAGQDLRTTLTTPEAPDLHALFAVMREHDVAACCMEVSSHALVQGRVDGVAFDVAVFLNLGRDHLDFHTDLADYFDAKAALFTPQRARLALVNVDDDHGRQLLTRIGTDLPVRTLALDRPADWRALDVVTGPAGSSFVVAGPDGLRLPVELPVPGGYNVANALAALASCAEAGLDVEAVAAGLAASPGVPGRLERVDAGQPFLLVVDYAHKPDAVEAAVAALRPLAAPDGRVIVVLGAGGDRDPGKRPLMGEVAARLADVLVVTDDNPRSESPAAIRAALLAGARSARAEVLEIGDRGTAIAQAVGLARPGDVVLVAGKGHETGQEVDGVVHPFDDRDVARATLLARTAAADR